MGLTAAAALTALSATLVAPPLGPTGLTGVSQGGSPGHQVALSWVDRATDESGYQVVRVAPDGGHRVAWLAAHPGTGAVGWTDRDVRSGWAYTYRVRAYRSSTTGRSWSSPASVSVFVSCAGTAGGDAECG